MVTLESEQTRFSHDIPYNHTRVLAATREEQGLGVERQGRDSALVAMERQEDRGCLGIPEADRAVRISNSKA